jgi:hypothetical protein
MLIIGAVGALGTRLLYAEQTVSPRVDEVDAVEEGHALALPEVLSPRPRALGQSEDDADGLLGTVPMTPFTPYRRGGAHKSKSAVRRAERSSSGCWPKWCILKPPAFSATRCGRALLATFSGMVMWIASWDLLDEHLLPTMFSSCAREPSMGCAAVKLSLVAIGAFGLYLTRSLYGDPSQTEIWRHDP